MNKDQIKREKNWAKKCIAISIYHTNQTFHKQSNKRTEKWTIRDTANELELSIGYISESLKLAKSFEMNPELISKTRDAALKFVKES